MAEQEKPKRGRPRKHPAASQPNSLSIRGSDEWREWLARYAEYRRTTPTGLLDMILAESSRRDKFEAPPRRI